MRPGIGLDTDAHRDRLRELAQFAVDEWAQFRGGRAGIRCTVRARPERLDNGDPPAGRYEAVPNPEACD